jgi:hypothetical protein
MSDFDREFLLLDAVHEFRAEALPHVHPAGTGAVRATVRRRRQVRTVTLAALVAILVLAPVAAFAAIGGDRRPQPATTATASPSASPSAADSPSASPSATPSATPSSAPPAPDAPTDLSNATIVLGAWGDYADTCPTGPVTFAHGSKQLPGKAPLTVEHTAAIDVDHDGGTETVAVIYCQGGQVGPRQAVAVKAAPDGTLTTMGQVLRTDSNVADIKGVAAGPNGTVALTVGDILVCCATQPSEEVTQVRTYAWNGSGFTQADGPTTFIADPAVADLAVSAPTLNFGPKVNGTRTGTLTVTVRNKGPQAAGQVSLSLVLLDYFANGPGQDWAKCPVPAGSYTTRLCQLGNMPAGATVTLTLPLTTQADASYMQPADNWFISIQPRRGDLKYPSVKVSVTFS